MKKWISLFLTAMMLLGGGLALAEAPLTEEPVTFKIVVGRQVLDLSDNYNEKLAAKNAEERTNIHIDWVELTDAEERVNLMLASGDLPDAFLCSLKEQQLLKNVSQFVPLNDLIEEYAPNVKAQYDSQPDLWDKVTMTDGNIYSLAINNYTNYDNWAGGIPVYNAAWLEKLGLDFPTNMDEFYDVLVAIRDGDPNGNGLKDEIPLEFCEKDWCTHILEYGGSWGFTNYYKVEDGQYIPTAIQPEFREFLEYFHKLASEGLLDVEGFSQTMQQWVTKAKEDRCFAFYTWTANGLFDEEKANEYKVMPIVPAAGFEGKAKVTGEVNRFEGNRFGFAITKSCENPELLLQWFDDQNRDTKAKYEWFFGEEGLLWEMDDDGNVWQIYPEATAEMSVENMKYTYGFIGYGPTLILPGEVARPNAEKSPAAAVRSQMVDEIMPFIPTEALPVRSVPADKISARELIWTDLKAYLDGFVASSIMDGVTDESWEAHLVNAEMYGLSEWTQWYQDFIDGAF